MIIFPFLVKQIKKAGCNVLLVQKSILRDALSDLAIHFFDKMKIMVVKDIEREDIEHVCKSLGCSPIASLDHFTPDKLADAGLVEEGDYYFFTSKCLFTLFIIFTIFFVLIYILFSPCWNFQSGKNHWNRQTWSHCEHFDERIK